MHREDPSGITGTHALLRRYRFGLTVPVAPGPRPRRLPSRRPGTGLPEARTLRACLAGVGEAAQPPQALGADVEVQRVDVVDHHLRPGPRRLRRRRGVGRLRHHQRHLLLDLPPGGRPEDAAGRRQVHQRCAQRSVPKRVSTLCWAAASTMPWSTSMSGKATTAMM